MSALDELWAALEPHLSWPDHLALLLLFADHPDGVDELRRRCETLLAAEGRTLMTLMPSRAQDLTPAVMQLATRVPREVGVVWLELWRGSGNADWDAAIDDQLARLNAGRTALGRDVGRPLVVVLPTRWRTRVHVAAPDLWTIRSFTAVVPGPTLVPRGLQPAQPEPLQIFTVGPPSAAEREWARLWALGQPERIDAWDGFRAVAAAQQRGSLASARQIAEQTLELVEDRYSRDPNDVEIQRARSVALGTLADIELVAGDLAKARALYSQVLQQLEQLAAVDAHALVQRDLALVLHKCGDLEDLAGDISDARAYYERAVVIYEDFASAHPDDVHARQDWCQTLRRLGDLETENLPAARMAYERSLQIAEDLATAHPSDVSSKRLLSDSLQGLIRFELGSRNLPKARALLERALRVTEELKVESPQDVFVCWNEASVLDAVARLETLAGDHATAQVYFGRCLTILGALAAADPQNAFASFDVVFALLSLADVQDEPEARRQLYVDAATRLRKLDENGQVDGFRDREAARERLRQLLPEPG